VAPKQVILASACVLAFVSTANAAELCVRCSAPDARYACVVNTPAPNADTLIKLYCITTLAKAGGHESCAIDRASAVPCQGTRKELPVPSLFEGDGDDKAAPDSHKLDANAPAGPAPPPGPAASTPDKPKEAKDAPADAPPKTVQEMIEKSTKSAGQGLSDTQKSAGNAASSAGTALQKAGTAVTDAAKTSWQCLTTFFSKCSQ
jgi:hypothetical protein